MNRRTDPSVWVRQAGILTAIPFVLLVGPALGYYLGTVIDRRWSVAPWGITIGIVLGLLASAKVTMDFRKLIEPTLSPPIGTGPL